MLTTESTQKKTQQLWDQFRMGNEDAYALLYEEYAQAMFSFGMRFATNRELVKDCIHDVFVKIYSNRPNLSPTDNVKLYLFIALKNELVSVFRKEVSFCSIENTDALQLNPVTPSDESLISKEEEFELNQTIVQVFEILSPRQREVLYYRYIEELSFEEIEQIMQINYQSIQNLIQRSFKKIRKSFPELAALSLFSFFLCTFTK